jgi:hypothetical protein
MLTSISPLGERARHNRWAVTVAWYLTASVAAGGAVGLALGALGALLGLPPAARAIGWAVLAAPAVLVDLGALPLPAGHRQVNEDWLNRYRGWVYGSAFGAQLGVGVVTIVTSASVYLTLLAEVAVASPLGGLAVGLTFGLVRAAPVLVTAGTASFGQLTARHRTLVALAQPVRTATVVAMSLGGVVAALLAVRGMF